MQKLGICEEWIAQTATFYKGATSAVMVNGTATPEFELERGVRQGCPMAPYLYLFVQDVLGYMLCDLIHNIEGLTLPDSSILMESFFTDDSSIFLKCTKENLERTFAVLDLFCVGNGA